MITPFLALNIASAMIAGNIPDGAVTEVHHTAAFAGKYGDRVTETLQVRAGSDSYTVVVQGAYHTRFMPEKLRFKAGDRLSFKGREVDGKIFVRRDNIRRLP
jgi:hypothetical protein